MSLKILISQNQTSCQLPVFLNYYNYLYLKSRLWNMVKEETYHVIFIFYWEEMVWKVRPNLIIIKNFLAYSYSQQLQCASDTRTALESNKTSWLAADWIFMTQSRDNREKLRIIPTTHMPFEICMHKTHEKKLGCMENQQSNGLPLSE